MKLNKQNYELIIFDLVEGNLTSNEAQEVLKQIESDPFYKEQYHLMLQSNLKFPEEIIFEDKHLLIKSENPLNFIWKSNLIRFAIAALIIFMSLFYFWMPKSKKMDKNPIVESKIISPPQAPNNNNYKSQIKTNIKADKQIIANHSKPSNYIKTQIPLEDTLILEDYDQKYMPISINSKSNINIPISNLLESKSIDFDNSNQMYYPYQKPEYNKIKQYQNYITKGIIIAKGLKGLDIKLIPHLTKSNLKLDLQFNSLLYYGHASINLKKSKLFVTKSKQKSN